MSQSPGGNGFSLVVNSSFSMISENPSEQTLSSRLRLIDQESEERSPDWALQEDLVEFANGLLVLTEQEKGQTEPSTGNDIPRVDSQASTAGQEDMDDVGTDLVCEPPGDLVRGERGVEEECSPIVRFTLRVAALIPSISPSDGSSPGYEIQVERLVGIFKNHVRIGDVLAWTGDDHVRIGEELLRLAAILAGGLAGRLIGHTRDGLNDRFGQLPEVVDSGTGTGLVGFP
jgi:hypothetical protein